MPKGPHEPKVVHSEEERKQVAQRVGYEWEMFQRLAVEWSKLDEEKQPVLKNAVLEAFLLHARNMRNFLYCSRKDKDRKDESPKVIVKDDDVLAEDFIDDSTQWQPPSKTGYIWDEKERLDKALAHISYARIDYHLSNNKQWNIGEIMLQLAEVWEKFWHALPPEKRAWFEIKDASLSQPEGAEKKDEGTSRWLKERFRPQGEVLGATTAHFPTDKN